ncbi:DUF421 domain-containing protein [Litchfieldia alkalitelluris]|uniref:DUF421 domain-containing protein n=1 Tax=Litchfieldia alkalitelluris TaxID=304268 RepID=UPI0009972B1D|nr:DUF421 domain-containing protein [Litchfieldia alkalitelluris]
MDIMELILRVALTFITLLALTRIMGRKELSQLTFFNFVSGITIGSISANLISNSNFSIRNGIIALAGWTIFTVAMGFLNIKSKKIRTLVEGQPVIVVKDGKIMEDALKRLRLDVDALSALLRQKNVFSMADVNYAILETDGKLSVMKKEDKQSVTKSDMSIQKNQVNLYPTSTEVITDGKIVSSNLSKLNLTEDWLEEKVKQSGLTVSDVFYAEIQKDGSIYIDARDDLLH